MGVSYKQRINMVHFNKDYFKQAELSSKEVSADFISLTDWLAMWAVYFETMGESE